MSVKVGDGKDHPVEEIRDPETGYVTHLAGEWEPGPGGWHIRSKQTANRDGVGVLEPDHYRLPKVIPQERITTQGMIEGTQRIEIPCERCGMNVSRGGPGVIAGRYPGSLICHGCALNGSESDRLMASLVKRSRGRQPRRTGETE